MKRARIVCLAALTGAFILFACTSDPADGPSISGLAEPDSTPPATLTSTFDNGATIIQGALSYGSNGAPQVQSLVYNAAGILQFEFTVAGAEAGIQRLSAAGSERCSTLNASALKPLLSAGQNGEAAASGDYTATHVEQSQQAASNFAEAIASTQATEKAAQPPLNESTHRATFYNLLPAAQTTLTTVNQFSGALHLMALSANQSNASTARTALEDAAYGALISNDTAAVLGRCALDAVAVAETPGTPLVANAPPCGSFGATTLSALITPLDAAVSSAILNTANPDPGGAVDQLRAAIATIQAEQAILQSNGKMATDPATALALELALSTAITNARVAGGAELGAAAANANTSSRAAYEGTLAFLEAALAAQAQAARCATTAAAPHATGTWLWPSSGYTGVVDMGDAYQVTLPGLTSANTMAYWAYHDIPRAAGQAPYDTWGCTTPSGAALSCSNYGACCDVHDRCYHDNGCTAASWTPGNKESSGCTSCNLLVMMCFLDVGQVSDGAKASCCAAGTCGDPLCWAGETPVDALHDQDNCGTCGNVCPSGTSCQSGACLNDDGCPPGQDKCTATSLCTTVGQSDRSCGACSIACASGTECQNGSCQSKSCTSDSQCVELGQGFQPKCENGGCDPLIVSACHEQNNCTNTGMNNSPVCNPACQGNTHGDCTVNPCNICPNGYNYNASDDTCRMSVGPGLGD